MLNLGDPNSATNYQKLHDLRRTSDRINVAFQGDLRVLIEDGERIPKVKQFFFFKSREVRDKSEPVLSKKQTFFKKT